MSRLKECIAKVRGVLTEAEEEFILNAAKESNIRDSVEAANYGINAFYKMLHDDLNALKKSLGLEEVPYPDFVLENDMAAKEAKPKAPSLSLLKRAEKAKRIKELTRAFQLVAQYNELKKEEKASIRGLKIMRELQDEAAKINADLYFSRRGATLKEKTGAVIKNVSKKNTQMSIAERKNKEEIYKKAMAMNPVNIAHSIALDVISGVVFSLDSFKRYTKLSPKEIKTVPKFRVNNGYDSVDLDLYSVKYKENAGEIQYSDPDEIANMATEELEKYLSPGGRERAIEFVLQKYLESVESEKNENLSESQLKYLEELQDESNELEKIIEDIESERELLLKDENTILEAQEAEIRDAIEIDKLNDDLNNLLNLEYARESAQAQINKEIEEKLNKGEITPQEAEQAYFYQKKNETKKVGNINKVVSIIRKAMPKVIIEFDTNLVDEDGLPAAGRVKGNVLTINPDYASLDTPIHEAAHILIDAIGYNNKVIQAAIAELKDTDLWKETKKAYSNLNEEMLGKEVLAEAIGREGADIFETESQKSKFKAMLSYIFDRLKRLFGIEKNVAKSLAKQIIAGIGTKNLVGTTAEVQMSKKKVLTDAQAKVKDLVDAIEQEENLSAIPFEELLDVYNSIESLDIPGKTKYLKGIKTRIAMNIFEREKVELAKDKEFSAERAAVKDISVRDIKFKVLSHFTNDFPELRFLSDVWDAAFFNRTKEAKEGKRTNEKLALEVIKERRARLGLGQRAFEFAESLFTNINYKFFDYLDAGNGKMITLNEAKKKNLSKAQIEYLKFVRDLIATRKELLNQPDIYNMDMEVLKLDKGFYESYKNEGFAQAYGYWLSSSENLRQAKIMFTNPITGKTSEVPYEVAESVLIKYGEKGAVEKAKSLALILKYNFAARRKKSDLENKQRGTYYLDDNGQLQSKFNRKRPDDAPYSKDFYKAVTEFIDDSAHIKHISPLMPVIESIEYLNNNGVYEYDDEGNKVAIHAEKPNVVKWLDEWKDLHILRQKRTELGPELDSGIKFLRFMTSATTMMFNVPAAIINVAIGNYNIWRAENNKVFGTGLKRLFGGERKFTKDYGYGFVNPIAVDIAKKYGAVSTDIDSNPIQTAGGIMSKLGHAMTKFGEFQIQASGLLGLMSDEDYNSFEYAKNKFGVDELVFKKSITEEKKRAIEKRILKHINRVSDIQGKYSEKDRRNIQNTELGKAIMQFKVYLPDYWRMRFGREEGSFNIMLRTGLKELRADIKKNGLKKGLWDNQSKEAIAFMSNLKGAAAVTFFMILAHSNDDDDDDSVTANAQKMLSNLLGVFDPEQLKFTITHPIAAMGIVDKFLTAVEHLAFWDEASYNKAKTKYGEKGDAKIVGDIIGLTPGKKVADMFIDDEN